MRSVTNPEKLLENSRRSKVKVTQGQNLANFDLISPFPDHNLYFKPSIATKCYWMLQIVLNRRPIDFEGNRSKVKVTQGKNLANFDSFGLNLPRPDIPSNNLTAP